MTTTDRRAGLQRSRRRTLLAVYASAAAAFAIAAGWLGLAMAQGRDPALGPATRTASASAQERRVLVRRIVTTRRIRVAPTVASASAVRSAPAPVPAPAPAPVQTSTS